MGAAKSRSTYDREDKLSFLRALSEHAIGQRTKLERAERLIQHWSRADDEELRRLARETWTDIDILEKRVSRMSSALRAIWYPSTTIDRPIYTGVPREVSDHKRQRMERVLDPVGSIRPIASVPMPMGESKVDTKEKTRDNVKLHESRFDLIDRAIALGMYKLDDDGATSDLDPWTFPKDATFQRIYDAVAKDPMGTKEKLDVITGTPRVSLKHGVATNAKVLSEMWTDFGFSGAPPEMTVLDTAALAEFLLKISWKAMGAKSSGLSGDNVVGVTFPEGRAAVHPAGGVRVHADGLRITLAKTGTPDSDDGWETIEGKQVRMKVRPFRFSLASEKDIGWNIIGASSKIRHVRLVIVQGHVELNKTGLDAEARAAVMMIAKGIAFPEAPDPPTHMVVLFDEATMAQDLVITIEHVATKARIMRTRVVLAPKP